MSNEETTQKPAQDAQRPNISDLLNAAFPSTEEAARAFKKIGDAARKVEFPGHAEVRQMRLDRLKSLHGPYRFIMPKYYKWLLGI